MKEIKFLAFFVFGLLAVVFFSPAGGSFTPSAYATSTDTEGPSAPGGFNFSYISPSRIDFSWTASTDNVGVAGYFVNRSGDQIATTSGLNYSDSSVEPGGIYDYWVVAYDAAGNLSSLFMHRVKAELGYDAEWPTAPTNFNLIGVQPSGVLPFGIEASWFPATDNVGVAGYRVYRGDNVIATTTGTSYIDREVLPNTTYNYMVRSFDAARNFSNIYSSPSGTAYVNPDTASPSIPSALVAVAVSASQINLSWSASTDNFGVAGYRIFRDGLFLATSTGVSYSDAGLAGATQYVYTVLAFDASRNFSSQSLSSSATTNSSADLSIPTIPGSLSATAISSSQINLSWSASTDNVGVAGYQIYRNGYLIATTTGSTYSNYSLAPATAYGYNVVAFDVARNFSSQSSRVYATTNAASSTGTTTDSQAPSTPTGLIGSPFSNFQINLSWHASTDNIGVVGYRVYRNGFLIATSTSNSYINIDLAASTTYRYNVSAFDARRNFSALSATTTIKTALASTSLVIDSQAPSAPQGLTASAAAYNRITLSWLGSSDNIGVAGYRIYRNKIFVATSTSTTYNDSGLSAYTLYYYNVSAFDARRNSSPKSATSSARTLAIASSTANLSTASSSKITNSTASSSVRVGSLSGATSATVENVTSAESARLPVISTRTELNSACKTVYEKVVSVAPSTDSANRYAIASFIQNGTETTRSLGAGERGGVISSFNNTFKRLPANQNDWQDVIKIANGRWPKQRNASLEESNKTNSFKKIYRRLPNMANANDNAAVTILTYGLRPASRSLINEAASIKSFKYIYRRAPSSAADWDVVRAIAYSGAKR